MSTATCPICDAEISLNDASRSDPRTCPFCGADVSEVEFHDGGAAANDEAAAAPTASGLNGLPPLPRDSRITVVDASGDRLVLSIRAAGTRALSLVLFAVLWNATAWLFAGGFFIAALKAGPQGAAAWQFTFATLFIAVGVGLAAWAIHATFLRTLLLIERNRAAVQTILLRKRTNSIELGPESYARLEEAYYEGDRRPVYRVAIIGPYGKIGFGTALSGEDKDWVVRAVNGLLGNRDAARETLRSSDRGGPLKTIVRTGEPAQPVSPANLSNDSDVTIEEDSGLMLRFSVRCVPPGSFRKGATATLTAVLAIVGLVFGGWIWRMLGGAGPQLFNMIVLLGGLLPFLFFALPVTILLLLVLRSRITTTVGPDTLTVRWSMGRWERSSSVAIDEIDKVAVGCDGRTQHVALVTAGSKVLPLTLFHGLPTGREVAGLVRWQLERLGHALS